MSKVFTPHDYQKRGVDVLSCDLGGAALGLDPGMGKTAIAATAYLQLREQYPGLQMLVIVPINPMYGTWPDEIKKWEHLTGLRVSIIHGSPSVRTRALERNADIYLINPEGVKWLFNKNTVKKHPDWKLLCVDESTKFKKSDTERFKALKPHLEKFFWRWILTGTIAPNGLMDLFGQVYVMDQGRSLGKFITHFRHKYFDQPDPYNRWLYVPKPHAMENIVSRFEGRFLLLKAEDYLDMPDFHKVLRKVKLPPKVMEIYSDLEDEFIHEVEDSLDDDVILAENKGAAAMKLRQIANGCVYSEQGVIDVHNEKLEALQDVMEETNGLPLLIMYEFKHDLAKLMDYLGKDAVCLTGMKGDSLTNTLSEFNKGAIKYLIMHPASAHGLNIQKYCRHIVWYSIPWNLESFIQSNTRLYRQGQAAPSVMCYLIAAEDTLDMSVAKALARKETDLFNIENAIRRHCGFSERLLETQQARARGEQLHYASEGNEEEAKKAS